MDLNLIKDVVKEIQKNDIIDFYKETHFKAHSVQVLKEKGFDYVALGHIHKLDYNQEINQNRKEGHLYLVTEDRNGEVYLWDFTEKPEHEFKEVFTSKELIDVAKEGAMLQFKDGKYELYSTDGYDMLENG